MSFKTGDSGISLKKNLIKGDGSYHNVAGATVTLKLVMPDRTVKSLSASLDGDTTLGGVTYVTDSTTLDQVGHYQGQYLVQFSPSKIIRSDRFHFDVEEGIT